MTTVDRRFGRSKESRAETLKALDERLTQSRYGSLASRWSEARATLATETLRRMLMVPSLTVNIDSYIANAGLPCEKEGCGAVRYLDGGLCYRHFESLSLKGDLYRLQSNWNDYGATRDEVRRFLAHPSNAAHPSVRAAALALKAWIAGPPLPLKGMPAGRIPYRKVRAAISSANPKPSDVLAAVVGLLLHEARLNPQHEPLIDTMRQDWTFAGATLVGRSLSKLARVGSRADYSSSSGYCRRLLAQSLPEVVRTTTFRLVAAIEADRRVNAEARQNQAVRFVSPTTGLHVTVSVPPLSAKEADSQ